MEIEKPIEPVATSTFKNQLPEPELRGFTTLKKIRRLVDHIILQIYSQQIEKSSFFNDEILDDLN